MAIDCSHHNHPLLGEERPGHSATADRDLLPAEPEPEPEPEPETEAEAEAERGSELGQPEEELGRQ